MSTPTDDAFVMDEEALRLAQELDAGALPAVQELAIEKAILRDMIAVTEIIRRQVRDPYMREDLAQETWMAFTASVKAGHFHNRGIDPRHFIMVIARNRIKHYFTRDPQMCHIEVPLPEDDLLETLAASDDIADAERRFDLDTWFNAALAQLVAEERPIAHLWRQGWTVSDIADQTGRDYRKTWVKIQKLIKLIQRAAQAEPQR